MPVLSIGDRAGNFLIRRQSVGLRAEMTRLGAELATGRKQNLGKALAGDFGPFAAIERSLSALAAYKTANSEASGLLGGAQLALENVQAMAQGLGPALLTAGSARDVTLISATSEDARQKFSAVVSSFNLRVADRTMFAGAATDRPALASGDAMMAELATVTSGETTAAGIIAVVDAWFDTPGGGFETVGYLGSNANMAPLQIAAGESLNVALRADDTVIRETLKSFALAGLIAQGALPGTPDEQAALISEAAARMLTNDGEVTNMRARLGAIEARVEDARARNAAEASAYEIARAELVGADPYNAATELEAVYAQIETLYLVTARIASLNFTDYMK